jgi:hypothetical protein
MGDQINYTCIQFETTDALYAVVIWPLPGGKYAVEVHEQQTALLVMERGVYSSRDEALLAAGGAIYAADLER